MTDPDAQLRAMIENLEPTTGHDLDAWLALTVPAPPVKFGELVAWLKSEHGVTHGFANLIARRTLDARSGGATTEPDLVAAQYAGPKANLRPILDAITRAVTTFGDDVVLAPKKTCVSLRRARQFALVQPSTKTRVDVGIQLPGVAAGQRLEASGSFSAMVSHRVRLEDAASVDDELIGWLRAAYDAAG